MKSTRQNGRQEKLHPNQLTSLPEEIGKMGNIIDLSAQGNKLVNIPPEIGNLKGSIHDFLKKMRKEGGKPE